MATKKSRRPQLLSSTRSRNLKPKASLSSQATRALVRKHHTLRKELSRALTDGDSAVAQAVQVKIDTLGGLSSYQDASIQGQSAQRGGDTSRVLVEWLSDLDRCTANRNESKDKLRLLEIGSLSPDNACSRSGIFDLERIDLHSQHPDIKEQDFMQRPIPNADNLQAEGFDVVSLSLVLNFVAQPMERGQMLRRVASFFRRQLQPANHAVPLFPGLFLVLPSPCVINSRYLDEERLTTMMKSLGYEQLRRKLSSKLVYYLWRYDGPVEEGNTTFKKETVRSGKSRNNFAIIL